MPRDVYKPIWVPGEESEYGVVVQDVATEEAFLAPEKGKKITVRSRSGKPREVLAVRCELVRVEETRSGKRLAVVRVAGKTARVLVLGDWQLAGEPGLPADATA